MSRLYQDFNEFFRPCAEKPSPLPTRDSSAVTGQWIPPINIHLADRQFFISLNIPRIDVKDVELHIHNRILSIKTERKFHRNQYRNGYYSNESAQEVFYRRFSIPEAAAPKLFPPNFAMAFWLLHWQSETWLKKNLIYCPKLVDHYNRWFGWNSPRDRAAPRDKVNIQITARLAVISGENT